MIRHAQPGDLPAILDIYAAARAYMRENGNAGQWGDHYPPRELVEADIRARNLYVVGEGGALHGVFALIHGEEPAYARIEGGSWQSGAPYATIHRVAADGTAGGVFARCMAYCKARSPNLRIDTHADNKTMRRLIERHGFARRGTIYLEDGSPRIAYEWTGAPG